MSTVVPSADHVGEVDMPKPSTTDNIPPPHTQPPQQYYAQPSAQAYYPLQQQFSGSANNGAVVAVHPLNIEAHNREQIQASTWMAKLGIGLLSVVWAILFFLNQAAILFPLVFIPTAIFLASWKYKHRYDESVNFWALVTAYVKGFYPMGFLAFTYRFFFLVIVLKLADRIGSVGGFVFLLVLYCIFGEAWVSEWVKYRIARNGRTSRPDLTDVYSFLWYSISGALGYSTSLVGIGVFFSYSSVVQNVIAVLAIAILLELPLHVLTGFLIGVDVAKNEVFKWNLSGIKIYGPSWIIKALSSVFLNLVVYADILTALILYVVLVIGTFIYAWRKSKDIPSSFTAILLPFPSIHSS